MPAEMKPITASARRLTDDLQPVRTVTLRAVNDPSQHQVLTNSTGGTTMKSPELAVNLTAALVAVSNDTPMVLTTSSSGIDALPSEIGRAHV